MAKLTNAYKEQISSMRKDGKSDEEITQFFSKVYKIRIHSVEEVLSSFLKDKNESTAEINNNAVDRPYNKKYTGEPKDVPISLTPRVFWRINFSYTEREQKKILSFLTEEKAISKKEKKSALKEIMEYISLAVSWLGSADITPIKRDKKRDASLQVTKEILDELKRMPNKKRLEINQRIHPQMVETEIYKLELKLKKLKAPNSKCTRDLAHEEVVSNLVALWIQYTGKIPGRINRRKGGKTISIPSPCFKFIEYSIVHALSHINRTRSNPLKFKTKLSNTFRNVIGCYASLPFSSMVENPQK